MAMQRQEQVLADVEAKLADAARMRETALLSEEEVNVVRGVLTEARAQIAHVEAQSKDFTYRAEEVLEILRSVLA